MKANVFLCYTQSDSSFSNRLGQDLKQHQFSVYLYESDYQAGSIHGIIEERISNSQYFLVVLSPDAVTSKWVKGELNVALELERKKQLTIIPVLYRQCDIPLFLRDFKKVDFSNNRYDDALEQLLSMLNHPKSLPPAREGSMNQQLATESNEHIPFINQEKVIKNVLSPVGDAKFIIDGPFGCGKTHLLRELKRIFEKPEHFRDKYKEASRMQPRICAFVSVYDHSLQEFVSELYKQFKVETPERKPTTEPGKQFANSIIRDRRDRSELDGYVLFVDIIGIAKETFIKDLFLQFIPDLYDSLSVIRYFEEDPSRFRIILAGSHITTQLNKLFPDSNGDSRHGKRNYLSPFSHYHLKETARQYLGSKLADKSLEQICQHIYHYSGGHTRCMVELLRLYERSEHHLPNDFLRYERAIVEQIVSQERHKLENGWPADLKAVLERISGFRVINSTIFGNVICNSALANYEDVYALWKRLNGSNIWENHAGLLYNRHHRIMSLDLRRDPEYSKMVQAAYLEYLKSIEHGVPQYIDKWAVEYLYQALQSKLSNFDSEDLLDINRKRFFEEELPFILNEILSINSEWQERHEAIKNEIRNDQDFQFTINYYLGRPGDDVSMFDRLIERIDHFFEESLLNNGRGMYG